MNIDTSRPAKGNAAGRIFGFHSSRRNPSPIYYGSDILATPAYSPINLTLRGKTVRVKGFEASYSLDGRRMQGGNMPKVTEKERIAALEERLKQLKAVQVRKDA